jgi:hypothetical protein
VVSASPNAETVESIGVRIRSRLTTLGYVCVLGAGRTVEVAWSGHRDDLRERAG